jgi:micrococcal nuclease
MSAGDDMLGCGCTVAMAAPLMWALMMGPCSHTLADKPVERFTPHVHNPVPIVPPVSTFPCQGTVKLNRVVDGDTVVAETLLNGAQQQIRIRLANIDAPEMTQAGGEESKAHLSALIPHDTQLSVRIFDQDRYHRYIGEIYRNDMAVDYNLEMVQDGQAWVYTSYCRDLKFWLPLEEEARVRGVGLWSDPNPTPPWEYRAAHRNHGVHAEKSHP